MASKPLVFSLFFIGILFSSLVYSPFVLDYTLTPRLISVSIILVVSFYLWFKASAQKLVKVDFIVLSYIAYVLFSCVSGLWANTPTESIFENAKLVVALAVFLFGYYFFKSDKEHALTLLAKISVVIVLVECVLVSSQLNQLAAFNKEALYNVYGANSHKNLVSSFLYISLFFQVMGLFRLKKIWKWLTLLTLLLSLGMIAVIQTKAVWIALAVSVMLMLLLLLYKRINIKISLKWSLITGIILINVFFIFLQPRIIRKGLDFNQSQSQNDKAGSKKELDNERLQLWDKTYEMIHAHPVIGVGAGNWQIHFPDATLKGMYRAEDLNFTFQRPHNDLLWIIAETGFIGLNLFLLFVVSLLLFLIDTLKFVSERKMMIEVILSVVTIVGFFTAAFFDFPKERIEHLIWVNLVFAFAYSLIKENNDLKTLFEFKISGLYFVGLELILVITAVTGIYRYKGEHYTRQMYDRKKQNNNPGVIREAKKAVNFAYSIDPTSLPIKWYTGNSYAIAGNFNQAKTDLLEAYQLNPYNRNVVNDLASAYVNTNKPDSAEYYYMEASRISPRFDDPKLNLVAIYFNKRKFEKADSCLKTLLHDSERRTKYQKMVDAFLEKQK
ncbi:MAG: lipid core-O-antigen ligase-like enyme [Bacteroidota bacterium]|jgi:O-antigen ligase|nr:lipid core-O-antigen ligase-like enyme [Bacteroidota bacterium]